MHDCLSISIPCFARVHDNDLSTYGDKVDRGYFTASYLSMLFENEFMKKKLTKLQMSLSILSQKFVKNFNHFLIKNINFYK